VEDVKLGYPLGMGQEVFLTQPITRKSAREKHNEMLRLHTAFTNFFNDTCISGTSHTK
jgi:hypothetical protein